MPFGVKGHNLAIEWQLVQAQRPSTFQIFIERVNPDGSFSPNNTFTVDAKAPDYKGSLRAPLLPGQYHVKVDAPFPWKMKIFDLE